MMTTLQNIQQQLTNHKPTLQKDYKVGTIGIFGSFVTGQQSPDSDVDILIQFTQPIGWQFVDVKDYLENILQKKVDLVTPAALKPQFREKILQQVIYL